MFLLHSLLDMQYCYFYMFPQPKVGLHHTYLRVSETNEYFSILELDGYIHLCTRLCRWFKSYKTTMWIIIKLFIHVLIVAWDDCRIEVPTIFASRFNSQHWKSKKKIYFTPMIQFALYIKKLLICKITLFFYYAQIYK